MFISLKVNNIKSIPNVSERGSSAFGKQIADIISFRTRRLPNTIFSSPSNQKYDHHRTFVVNTFRFYVKI